MSPETGGKQNRRYQQRFHLTDEISEAHGVIIDLARRYEKAADRQAKAESRAWALKGCEDTPQFEAAQRRLKRTKRKHADILSQLGDAIEAYAFARVLPQLYLTKKQIKAVRAAGRDLQ